MSYSSSRAITSSTMSRESAPRSSMKDASSVTSSSLIPSCSQMISFTFCSTVDAIKSLLSSRVSSRAPSHVEPAVHVEHVPRHVPGGGRGEEGDGGRHLLGGRDAARRDH